MGFGGGFRRTELISIDYEDLDFVEEGVKITLRRSKTDQFGEGLIKRSALLQKLMKNIVQF